MGKYYTADDKYVFDGNTAVESDPNKINRDTEAAFELVDSDIQAIGSDAEAWANIARDWAIKDTEVEPGLDSSKTYADRAGESATQAANHEANTLVSETNSANCAGESKASAEASEGFADEAEGYKDDALQYRNEAGSNAATAFQAMINTLHAKEDAENAAASAEEDAEAAALSETNAKASEDAAALSEANAKTSEDSAEADAAACKTYAAVAQSAACQNLSEISAILGIGDIVDVFIYDTRNDSDGGAWTKQCRHTSWYNEVGDIPAILFCVITNTRLYLYSASTMVLWMEFDAAGQKALFGSGNLTSLAALNGVICVGAGETGNASGSALSILDFKNDITAVRINNYDRYYSRNIARRDELVNTREYNVYSEPLVNRIIHDVAMTALDGNPELVLNGDFIYGLTNWNTAGSTGTAEPVWSNGGVALERIDSSNIASIDQYIDTVVGHEYTVRFSVASGDISLRFRVIGSTDIVSEQYAAGASYEVTFTATTTSTRLYCYGQTDGGTVTVDSISAKSAAADREMKPIIAVATEGGVSVIDGPAGVDTVVDITGDSASFNLSYNVAFDGERLFIDQGSTDQRWIYGFTTIPSVDTEIAANSKVGTPVSPDLWYDSSKSVPGIDLQYLPDIDTNERAPLVAVLSGATGHRGGLTLVGEDTADPASGMVAYITSDYNTGWQQGDIKGAFLANTTEGAIGNDTTSEHIELGLSEATSVWEIISGGWSIADGQATCDGTTGGMRQNPVLTVDTEYRSQMSVTRYGGAGNYAGPYDGTGPIWKAGVGIVGLNLFTARETNLYVYSSSAEIDVDDVWVWEAEPEHVVNGIVDPADTGWDEIGAWVIGSGVAALDGSQASTEWLWQTDVTADAEYRLQVSVPTCDASTVSIGHASSLVLGTNATPGIYTNPLCIPPTAYLGVRASSSFDGSVDDIWAWLAGAEQINAGIVNDEDGWTFDPDWAITSGYAICSTGSTAWLYQDFSPTPGAAYRYQFSMENQSAGGVAIYVGGGSNSDTYTVDGIYSGVLNHSGSDYFSVYGNGYNGEVDNVWCWPAASERLANPDFTTDLASWVDTSTGTGVAAWQTGGLARLTRDVGVDNRGSIRQNISVDIGDVYEVTVNVDTGSTGQLQLFIEDLITTSDFTQSTVATVRPDASPLTVALYNGQDNSYIDINSVSLRKVTDLIENGEFSSDRAWTKDGAWTIGSGEASATGVSGTLQQAGVFEIGKTYIVQMNVESISAGTISLPYDGAGANRFDFAGPGIKTEVFTSSATTTCYIYGAGFTGTIKDVKVYEAEMVNGTWQPVGNILVNPSFEGVWDDTEWDLTLGSAEANEGYIRGVCGSSGVVEIDQNIRNLTVGAVYELSFDGRVGDATGLQAFILTTAEQVYLASIETFDTTLTATFKAENTTELLRLRGYGSAGQDVYFNNITVRQLTDVLQNGEFSGDRAWDKAAGWTIGGGQATHTAGTAGEIKMVDVGFEEGQTYICQVEISGVTAGNLTVQFGGADGNKEVLYTNGVHKVVGVAASLTQNSALRLNATSGYDGTIDNVKLYKAEKVGETWQPVGSLLANPSFEGAWDSTNWVAPGDAIVELVDGSISIDRNGEVDAHEVFYQNVLTPDVGSIYEVNVEWVGWTTNSNFSIRIGEFASEANAEFTTVGSKTMTFKANSSTTRVHLIPTGSITNGVTVNNVSVRKIPSLISNGEFSRDYDWTDLTGGTSGGTIAITGGVLQIIQGSNSVWMGAHQNFPCVAGRAYLVQATVKTYNTGVSVRLSGNIGSHSSAGEFLSSNVLADAGDHVVTLLAHVETSGDFYIALLNGGSATRQVDFLNACVYEMEQVDGTWQPVGTILSNPSFEGLLDETKWVAENAIVTVDDGDLRVQSHTQTWGRAYQDIEVESGRMYTISLDVVSNGDSASRQVWFGPLGNQSENTLGVYEGSTSAVSFRATETGTYRLSLYVGTADGQYATFNNISIKESQNLVGNGEFSADEYWTVGDGWTITGGVASCDGSQTALSSLVQAGVFTPGEQYLITLDAGSITAGGVTVYCGTNVAGGITGNGSYSFVATANDDEIYLQASADFIGVLDNIVAVPLSEADRSYNQNPLNVVGQLTKTAVAAGAEAVAYSGFTDENYLEQPYNTDLDYGTGDFYFSWWENVGDTSDTQVRIDGRYSGDSTGFVMYTGSGIFNIALFTETFNTGYTVIQNRWAKIDVVRRSGVLEFWVDGRLVYSGASVVSASRSAASPMWIGRSYGPQGWLNGSMALLRTGAGAPSAEQLQKMYNDEKHMFQAGAKCTLQGAGDSVLDLSYNEHNDEYSVAQVDAITEFSGLVAFEKTFINQVGISGTGYTRLSDTQYTMVAGGTATFDASNTGQDLVVSIHNTGSIDMFFQRAGGIPETISAGQVYVATMNQPEPDTSQPDVIWTVYNSHKDDPGIFTQTVLQGDVFIAGGNYTCIDTNGVFTAIGTDEEAIGNSDEILLKERI